MSPYSSTVEKRMGVLTPFWLRRSSEHKVLRVVFAIHYSTVVGRFSLSVFWISLYWQFFVTTHNIFFMLLLQWYNTIYIIHILL